MQISSIAHEYCPQVLKPMLARLEESPIGMRLARGVFWSMAGTAISRGLMLLATMLVARILGKTVYGELGMIRSTVGVFGTLAGFGLAITATKHVAEFRVSNPERASRIVGLSGLFATATGGLMALVLVVFAPWLAEHTINAPHLAGVLRIGALFLFINAVNGAQLGVLSGFEAFRTIAYVNLIVGLCSFPILVLGAYVGGLTGAVWALTINLGINWLLNHIALREQSKRFNVILSFKGCLQELPILWTFSLPAAISGIMVGPVVWACKGMLVNQPAGYAELGLFSAAEVWRTTLFIVCQMVTQANFPILAQLYGDGNRHLFKKGLMTQLYINGAITSLGALAVIVLSKPIVAAYGPEFGDGTWVLITVMVGCIPMQLASIAGTVNRCVGNIWWGVLLNGLWACVYLVSTDMLVSYGALGLAWATLVAYCFHLLFSTIYVVWMFRTSPKLALEPRT